MREQSQKSPYTRSAVAARRHTAELAEPHSNLQPSLGQNIGHTKCRRLFNRARFRSPGLMTRLPDSPVAGEIDCFGLELLHECCCCLGRERHQFSHPYHLSWDRLLTLCSMCSTFDETQSEQGRGGSVDFDQLDKEREAMDFEGLDDFLKGVEGDCLALHACIPAVTCSFALKHSNAAASTCR